MTKLSTEYWRMKDLKENTNVDWKIFGRHQPYNIAAKQCNLCLNQKYKLCIKITCQTI